MKKTFLTVICIVMIITSCCNFSVAHATEVPAVALDYDALFEKAYVINGDWSAGALQAGNTLSFYFRGKEVSESYDSARHFGDFDTAYNYYLSENPDILEDLPVFIFAPGTYDTLITVRYSAVILGANAGMDPNADVPWTLDGMANGVPENPSRGEETIFTAGITRTTRSSQNDAKWSYELEQKEVLAGKKADIKFIVDGIKLTGSVGISQYDYSNRLYTDLTLDGKAVQYTPTGNRTTLTALMNSVVCDFSGSGANALFSARCNSMNKNDAVMYNVRLTGVESSAKFLFNKFFRNLTIDGMYFANSEGRLFGSVTNGSSFCGDSTKTAEYDQNIEIKNSVFYKNDAVQPISLGNTGGGSGYTKMTADIHHNFFYDAVCCDEQSSYWGIFLVNSAKSGVEYEVNITDNIIHQDTTVFETLFNGNVAYQKSKTTVNFNRNKVTGEIKSIYPNTDWGTDSYEYLNTSVFYDFSDNFHSKYPTDIGSRPVWTKPPQTALANGYDYMTAPYYTDYDLTMLSTDFNIRSVSGLGSRVEINGYDVTADCSGMNGIITPEITAAPNTAVEIFSDFSCTKPVQTIDLSRVEKGAYYFIVISKGDKFVVGVLNIVSDGYSDINSLSELDASKFNLPVISVNTEGGAPIVDKENYVTCAVSISNTDSEFCISDVTGGIRYRGNSTLSYADKKPYRIKFDKKQNLFGFGKAKSWVLLANSFDKTMVRNAIAFSLGQRLGLEYTTELQFVNLYLNGKYQGLYLLCEQTQTGETRVDVEEDESGKVDTGYLIEMSGNGDPDEDRNFAINEIAASDLGTGVVNNWRTVIRGYLKTPELDVCTDEQVTFISDYINDVNRAILTQNWEQFNALCDVKSFAKYFVVNTVLNNGDGGYQIYMYKRENGGKLYAGPLWDFDQSAAASTHCGESYDSWYTGTQNPWFDSFANWPEFLRLAKAEYLENYGAIREVISYYTDGFYESNSYDYHANDVLWDSVEGEYWRIPNTVKMLKNYSANFIHLAEWFGNRLSWLDSAYEKVDIIPSKISLDKTAILLEKGEGVTISLKAEPVYSGGYQISWSSSDDSVATVQNGVVTAMGNGSCVITAQVVGTNISAACNVTVCIDHQDKTAYNGLQHYLKCSVCQRETEFANHSYVSVCDDTCDCGYKRVTTHKFGEYVYNNDATDLNDGTKTRTCTVCSFDETVVAVGTRIKLIDSSKIFKDVPANKWYKKYVDFAVTFDIFVGTSASTFSPDANMTRAQFVQVFANISGIDTSNRNVSSGFVDVPKGKWYTASVTWAAQNGVVSGMGNGIFAPDANVTREQMCVMIVNYIENYLGESLKTVNKAQTFADDASISGWAKEAVYKCANAALVSGVGNNKFDPKSSATRAQGATLFTNFYKEYVW